MKGLKGWTKWLSVGALAAAIAIPGAASAATPNYATVQYKVFYVTSGDYVDFNKLLQQYFQGFAGYTQPVVTKPVTTKPVTQPTAKPVTKPVTKTPVTKPVTKPTTSTTTTTKKPSTTTSTTTTASSYASQVVSLVNQERAKAGLKPLASNAKLSQMALVKAKDMKNNNYFDHNSPSYGSPFDMMKSFGITYRYAGENIAMGQRTPKEVMTAWMNSPGHKANILSANYTSIGVAYYNGEWVQEFTG